MRCLSRVEHRVTRNASNLKLFDVFVFVSALRLFETTARWCSLVQVFKVLIIG